jgi:hypothetical protein
VITEILPNRLDDTSSVQNPRITRSRAVRLGLRRWRALHDQQLVFDGQRFSSDRPNPAGTGELRESDQQVGDQINSNLIGNRALALSYSSASLRSSSVFRQNY